MSVHKVMKVEIEKMTHLWKVLLNQVFINKNVIFILIFYPPLSSCPM